MAAIVLEFFDAVVVVGPIRIRCLTYRQPLINTLFHKMDDLRRRGGGGLGSTNSLRRILSHCSRLGRKDSMLVLFQHCSRLSGKDLDAVDLGGREPEAKERRGYGASWLWYTFGVV